MYTESEIWQINIANCRWILSRAPSDEYRAQVERALANSEARLRECLPFVDNKRREELQAFLAQGNIGAGE